MQHANGANLYYEIHGSGAPLVLIHGLGSSHLDWEHQVPDLAAGYRVLALDLRGHGRSDKPAGQYSIALFAGDVAALMQAQGFAGAHVVGLSLGGAIAFQLALDHPQLVKTLVIVNSGPHAVMETFAQKFAIRMRFAVLRVFGLPRLGRMVVAKLFPEPGDEVLRRTFVERFERNDVEAYKSSLRALVGWSVMGRLGEIRCPLLALTADQDYSPVAYKQAYVDRVAGARLVVVPDSHHALPMEKPQAFNRALREFLATA
ncbi:MAG TPA: alpha/beta hydrolase [Solimonas sp.]|nr:alpha/beta hydrolase [Solimonas sp.]